MRRDEVASTRARSGDATTVETPGGGVDLMSTQRERSTSLQVTLDEAAVIELIRRTDYGEVTAKTRAGAIVGLERSETLRPPSHGRQPEPLGGGEA